MTERNKQVKGSVSAQGLFKRIAKGDFVTISDDAGERKGHATKRDHGNWILVLERNGGTAVASSVNTVAVSKPKRMAEPPKLGQRLVYDDGRRSAGTVVDVDRSLMRVLFDNRMEPTLIYFTDPQWMDYITFHE